MLRNMSERAGILLYCTNHSLRATTVTILSSNNVETQKIKAVTGHRSDTSIESYCERPTLNQFKHMSSTLSHFVHGEESTTTTSSSSDSSSIVPTTVPAVQSHPPVDNSSISFGRNEANILQTHGVSPSIILPSGTFHRCSFTFNFNN